ncbi:MAG: CPBP family glutamic-type intramembrane protease [Candidatus Aenigmatarchaeota archaeon]
MVKFEFEKIVIILSAIFFLFLSVNFSPQILGIIYVIFIAWYYFFILDSDVGQFPLYRGKFDLVSLVPVVCILVFVWFTVTLVVSNALGANVTSQMLFKVLGSQTTPPFVSNNEFLRLFILCFAIPLAETLFFFGVVLSYIVQVLHVNLARFDRSWIIASISTASIMTIFHLAVQFSTQWALLSTFIFAFISSIIVLRYRDLSYALMFHVIANTLIVTNLLQYIMIGW